MSTASAAPRAPAPTGIAIAFCAPDERPYLKDIEKLTRQQIADGRAARRLHGRGRRDQAAEARAQEGRSRERRQPPAASVAADRRAQAARPMRRRDRRAVAARRDGQADRRPARARTALHANPARDGAAQPARHPSARRRPCGASSRRRARAAPVPADVAAAAAAAVAGARGQRSPSPSVIGIRGRSTARPVVRCDPAACRAR